MLILPHVRSIDPSVVGSVDVTSGGVRTELRFAAGPLEKSALPLKLEVVAAAGFPTGVFDGAVSVMPHGSGVALTYSGSSWRMWPTS